MNGILDLLLVNLQYWQLDTDEINLKDVIAEFANLKKRFLKTVSPLILIFFKLGGPLVCFASRPIFPSYATGTTSLLKTPI
jgi:hypothetical protein